MEREEMGQLDQFFNKALPAKAPPAEQALVIVLDGASLADAVYEQHDLIALEDSLQDALGQLGVCDGSEYGPESTRIYLYGADAEGMFRAIEQVLLDHPLAAGSRVMVRQGPSGARQREIRLPRESSNSRIDPLRDIRSDRHRNVREELAIFIRRAREQAARLRIRLRPVL
jgi:hypothetical protein